MKKVSLDEEQIEAYWHRFRFDPKKHGKMRKESDDVLIIEQHEAECVVGFSVTKEDGCPLVEFDEDKNYNIRATLSTLQTAIKFRNAQAQKPMNGESPDVAPIAVDKTPGTA
jgi:hypothetical protein